MSMEVQTFRFIQTQHIKYGGGSLDFSLLFYACDVKQRVKGWHMIPELGLSSYKCMVISSVSDADPHVFARSGSDSA